MATTNPILSTLVEASAQTGLDGDIVEGALIFGSPWWTVTVEPNSDAQRLDASIHWNGQLTAADYVKALVVCNSFNTVHALPQVFIDGPKGHPLSEALIADANPIVITGHLVLPNTAGTTVSQVAGFLTLLRDAANLLAATFAEKFPNKSPFGGMPPQGVDTRAALVAHRFGDQEFPDVTIERIIRWFTERGIEDIPVDEDDPTTVNLAMDGTPIDVKVAGDGLFQVRIAARVPATSEPDPGQLLHTCNHANIQSRDAELCAVQEEDNWWLVSRVTFPVQEGLDDEQLNTFITAGVVGAGTKLKEIISFLRTG